MTVGDGVGNTIQQIADLMTEHGGGLAHCTLTPIGPGTLEPEGEHAGWRCVFVYCDKRHHAHTFEFYAPFLGYYGAGTIVPNIAAWLESIPS